MKANNTHLPVIVCMRGIAALSVALYHSVCTTIGFFHDNTILSLFHHLSLGVPLFFLISGIVIPLHMLQTEYSYKRFWKFALRRIIRVEPAYLVALAVGIAYWHLRKLIFGAAQNPLPSFQDILLHLGYLVPFVDGAKWVTPVFWTLAIEFQYYLFLAIFFPIIASTNRWIQNVAIFGCLVISMGFTNKPFLLLWLPLFFTGITYALFKFKRLKPVDFTLWAIVCLALLAAKDWEISILALAGLAIVHFTPQFTIKPIAWLGTVSYSLYLLHGLTGGVVVNLLSHHVHNGFLKGAVILLGVAVALASAWVLYLKVEGPSHKFAKKI